MTSFFYQAVGHPTYRFEERTICFCVPDKFRVKVPNIFICDQGAYGSTIGLATAGWLLRVLGIVPRRDRQSEDEVWLLLLTASAVLPASSCPAFLSPPVWQLASLGARVCLTNSVNI